jgi:hypothetical protein
MGVDLAGVAEPVEERMVEHRLDASGVLAAEPLPDLTPLGRLSRALRAHAA